MVANPFPDPVSGKLGNITIPVYFISGYPITFDVYDNLGRRYIHRDEIANGAWQNISFTAPESAGNYFIKVSAGDFQKTVTFSVIK
jgi:hypothetical protein